MNTVEDTSVTTGKYLNFNTFFNANFQYDEGR